MEYRRERDQLLLTQRAYDCAVERVIDGDTIDVMVDLGFSTFVSQRIRVFGVNCPELGTAEGRMIRQLVMVWLGADGITKPKMTLLSYSKLDKYGRRLADFRNEGRDIPILSHYLLANDYAVEYLP